MKRRRSPAGAPAGEGSARSPDPGGRACPSPRRSAPPSHGGPDPGGTARVTDAAAVGAVLRRPGRAPRPSPRPGTPRPRLGSFAPRPACSCASWPGSPSCRPTSSTLWPSRRTAGSSCRSRAPAASARPGSWPGPATSRALPDRGPARRRGRRPPRRARLGREPQRRPPAGLRRGPAGHHGLPRRQPRTRLRLDDGHPGQRPTPRPRTPPRRAHPRPRPGPCPLASLGPHPPRPGPPRRSRRGRVLDHRGWTQGASGVGVRVAGELGELGRPAAADFSALRVASAPKRSRLRCSSVTSGPPSSAVAKVSSTSVTILQGRSPSRR